jgi:hypothetical protein
MCVSTEYLNASITELQLEIGVFKPRLTLVMRQIEKKKKKNQPGIAHIAIVGIYGNPEYLWLYLSQLWTAHRTLRV